MLQRGKIFGFLSGPLGIGVRATCGPLATGLENAALYNALYMTIQHLLSL